MVKHELEAADGSQSTRQKVDTTSHVTLRSVITNRQAAILIGENGSTITAIRSGTTAELDISEHLRGAIERILSVSGPVEAVAQSFDMVSRTLLGYGIDSKEETTDLTIKLAIAHVYLGAIIGSAGYRLRQIIETSKTQIYASEFCLPLSSERSLSITGNSSGIRIAIAEIGKEYLAQKTKAETAVSNPFVPVSMNGRYGHPESFRNTKPHDTMLTPANPYGIPPASFDAPPPETDGPNGNIVQNGDPRAGPVRGPTKDKLVQQIFIPNDMVGSIIGKQGSKINEIRTLSGSHIKICEPDPARPNERQITVEGSQEQNQLALYMLYQRLESEKRRQ